MPDPRRDPLPETERLDSDFSHQKGALQADLPDARSLDGVTQHQTERAWPNLISEQCDSKNWKTSFQREVITGSTLPQRAVAVLAKMDQTTSMQDLDDVGSVFGSTRMIFKTLDFQIAKGLMKIINPESRRKVRAAEEFHEKKMPRC